MASLVFLPAMLIALAAHGAAVEPADGTLDSVAERLAAADCAGALASLNAGLAKGYPEAQLLAGSMYEAGTCMQRDWKKAVDYYAQAAAGGQRVAAFRLAAGFAAPENGPDIAAALWWASRAWPGSQVPACAVECAAADPDRFVAILRRWPRETLAACNYVTGVMTMLAGEMYFPGRAQQYDVDATLRMDFVPSAARIDIISAQVKPEPLASVVEERTMRNRSSKAVAAQFEATLHQVAERALKRYPQPSRIDPSWRVPLIFVFSRE